MLRRQPQFEIPNPDAEFAAEQARVQDMIMGMQEQVSAKAVVRNHHLDKFMIRTVHPDMSVTDIAFEDAPLEALLISAVDYSKLPDKTASEFWEKSRNKSETSVIHDHMESNPLLQVAAMETIMKIFGTVDAEMFTEYTKKVQYVNANRTHTSGALEKYEIWLEALRGMEETDRKIPDVAESVAAEPDAAIATVLPLTLRPSVDVLSVFSTAKRRRGIGAAAVIVMVTAGAMATQGTSPDVSAQAIGSLAPTTETSTTLSEVIKNSTTMAPVVVTVESTSPSTTEVVTSITEPVPTTLPSPETTQPAHVIVEPVVVTPVDTAPAETSPPAPTAPPNDNTLPHALCIKFGGDLVPVKNGVGLNQALSEKYGIDSNLMYGYRKKVAVQRMLVDYRLQQLNGGFDANGIPTGEEECFPKVEVLNSAVDGTYLSPSV